MNVRVEFTKEESALIERASKMKPKGAAADPAKGRRSKRAFVKKAALDAACAATKTRKS